MSKLTIAGGLYAETCIDPVWSELFGPGGRAAAALCNRGVDIELHCYFNPEYRYRAEFQASNFGFGLHITPGPTLSFDYFHFLSVPIVRKLRSTPDLSLRFEGENIVKQPEPPLHIEGDNIIRYGFLEGDCIVSGRNVVYDPQDAGAPAYFQTNGSSAERLAFVCNLGEGRALTGKTEPEEVASELLIANSAEVVVLKMGPRGALVKTVASSDIVPPHQTETVRKIGSGDVFTAEFAYSWLVEGDDPVTAAKAASLQTAYYCEFQTLPLRNHIAPQDLPAVNLPKLHAGGEYDVYLAGPFFDIGQRWLIEEARNLLLGMGLRVFSPIHDVGEGLANAVAEADLRGLDKSRIVFACLDGFDPGTVFEVGYAHARSIPIIGYGQNLYEHDRVMFEGSGCTIIEDFVSAIYRAVFWTQQ
jgi:hypothetical protein